ncbi:MAG: saccharopine dehydrogenase NADP-binding domain-containing protein, partial [Nonlabens sp.]
MRHILIIGAGKSTGVLVDYLLNKSNEHQLQLTIADKNLQSAQSLSQNHKNATAIELDIFEPEQRKKQISRADIVISMLPARFHIQVAKDCVALHKSMVTASYVSPEMEALDSEVKEKGLVFMNEIGVDPGV